MADLFDRFYLPEDVGISSIDVANFLQECDKAHYKLRTLHIIRHGKAVVDAARYPFRASDKRLVYSVSKTFTSTAIGFAVQEGLVNVNDPLLDYFPECKDLDMDPRAREITLRDVLTMSTGHERDTVGDMCNSEGTPWPEIFFTRNILCTTPAAPICSRRSSAGQRVRACFSGCRRSSLNPWESPTCAGTSTAK